MPLQRTAIDQMCEEFPALAQLATELEKAAKVIVEALRAGGTLYLCGNGGSFADALHIGGELKKSFEKPRPLPKSLQEALENYPGGAELAGSLHSGLRVSVLGVDPVLASAVENDIEMPHVGFAQELTALGRAGDVLLGISTSGNARNVLNAAVVAKALKMPVVVFTGRSESPLSRFGDVVIAAPATGTATVQGWHGQIYHVLCRVVEDSMFPAN